MSTCFLGLEPDKVVAVLLSGLTIISSTGDVVRPHIPRLDGAANGFVRCKVNYGDILSSRSVLPLRCFPRHLSNMWSRI